MVEQGEIIMKRVRLLGGRLREQALKEGLKDSDIAFVKITVNSLPVYEIEKVVGSPSTFVENYFFGSK